MAGNPDSFPSFRGSLLDTSVTRDMLRDWVKALLDENYLQQEGYMKSLRLFEKSGQEHFSGKWNRVYLLWGILMFQDWFKV